MYVHYYLLNIKALVPIFVNQSDFSCHFSASQGLIFKQMLIVIQNKLSFNILNQPCSSSGYISVHQRT